jgi:hypothetical protein
MERWFATNELQQGLRSAAWSFRSQVSPEPALVLHMSMHYHLPLATILGPVHDGNDH